MPHALRKILLPALALLPSCLDYGIGEKEGRPDTGSGVQPPDWTPEPFPGEACNGLDDDGDGEVDEGFPDVAAGAAWLVTDLGW